MFKEGNKSEEYERLKRKMKKLEGMEKINREIKNEFDELRKVSETAE